MRVKRITTSLAAGLSLALVATGCAAAENTAEGPVELTYWSWPGAPGADIVEEVIAGFEAENPDITVNYLEIGVDEYTAKVSQSLAAGEEIDVITVRPNSWAAEIEDFLVPVSEWPGGDDLAAQFQDVPIEQTTRLFTDGELMAVPGYSTGAVLGIYNVDILESVGVDQPPSTWAEFEVLSKALAAEGGEILPAVMPADDWFQAEFLITLIGQTEPEYYDQVRYEGASWDTEVVRDGIVEYKALYDAGVLDSSTLDIDYGTAVTLFDEGKAAVLFNGSWEAGRILNGNYGIMPVPAVSADDGSLRAFLDILLAIPANSTKTDAAVKFIDYLTVGAGVDVWASSLTGIPAIVGYELPEGVLETELEKSSYQMILDLINNPRSDRNTFGQFDFSQGAIVKQALFGNISPEEAATSMQVEFERGLF